MSIKQLLAFATLSLLVISLLAGCSGGGTSLKGNTSSKTTTTTGDKIDIPLETPPAYPTLPSRLTATKVGSIAHNISLPQDDEPGFIYKQGEKYGVVSKDGVHDTGAIYGYCYGYNAGSCTYYAVSDKPLSTSNARYLENICGLIDDTGKLLVPMQYMSVYPLNERYALAVETTGIIQDPEKRVTHDGENSYAGNWTVFDLFAGQKVEGFSGDTTVQKDTSGDIVYYTNAEGSRVAVNGSGAPVPGSARILEEGYYTVDDGIDGEVFNGKGVKQFDFDATGYCPVGYKDGYFVAFQYNYSETTKEFDDIYAIMNGKGEILSEGYIHSPEIRGELMLVGSDVYTVAGKPVLKGEYTALDYDPLTQQLWVAKAAGTFTAVTADGEIQFETDQIDNLYMAENEGFVNCIVTNGYYQPADQYSYKDKQYSLKGYTLAPWLITTADNHVVCTIDNTTLLEGYTSYTATTVAGECIYIYAQKADGGYDVYKIQ